MSKNTRWALAIVGVAIIIVAAVVIGTGKDNTDAKQSPTENTPAVTGATGGAGSGATTSGGSTSGSGGSNNSAGSGGATPGTGGDNGESGGASPKESSPEQTGGANAQGASISPILVAGKTRTIVVDKGETIVIRGRSSSSGEMHLHGYDKEVPLEPGKIARIKLKASIDGEFPIEFHLPGGESQVGTLRVNP